MTRITNQNEYDRMIGGRLKLIRDFVFFGCLAMRMKLVERTDIDFLAATDGQNIYYNPNNTKDLSNAEIVGLLAHEAGHPMLLHHLRAGARDHQRWNIACDFALNLVLQDSFKHINGATLPAGGCLDEKWRDMSAEEIYDRLPQSMGQPQDGEGEGQGKSVRGQKPYDDILNGAKGMSESEVKAEEARIKGEIQNAAALARKAGQMTSNLEKLVEAICEPKANWRSILHDFISSKAETDYNWALPHQRMLEQYGVVYPTLDGLKLGDLAIIVDASGSCWGDLNQFASELSDMLAQYECSIDVVYHDTKVTNVEHFTTNDLPIVIQPGGGGGTMAREAYDYVAENFRPVAVIHLTDGEIFDWEKIEVPDVPVLVACSHKPGMSMIPNWAVTIDIS